MLEEGLRSGRVITPLSLFTTQEGISVTVGGRTEPLEYRPTSALRPARGIHNKEWDEGVVACRNARIESVAFEAIVRCGHSAQEAPLSIEEVRRSLL
jgi:hypothetical protein